MSDPVFSLPEPTDLGDIWRGDTVTLPIWVAEDYDGNVIDLTGAALWFTAKLSAQLPDLGAGTFQQSTATSGVEIIDAVLGQYRITIEATKTASLTDSTAFFWDVQVRTADGRTITVKHGTVNVVADYTRTIA